MASRTKRIRVGLIGCNKRALWYGAIFDDIDPNVYSLLDPSAYYHMASYYKTDGELHIRQTDGFRLVKVYDRDAKAARRIAGAFRTKPKVCQSIDDVSQDVDLVFIANECADGSDNLELVRPGLNNSVPTFVDRPFAATVKDAKAMLALAKRKRTALLSCSHMRMLPHAARFKDRFGENGSVEQGVVQGHGPNPAHIADGIELALFLFAEEFHGLVQSVQSMGSWPLEIMYMRYAKDIKKVLFPSTHVKCRFETLVVNSHTSAARYAFWAQVQTPQAPIDSPRLGFDAFVQPEGGLGVMNAIQKMVTTGKSPLPPAKIIESVAVAEAGRKAHNKANAATCAR